MLDKNYIHYLHKAFLYAFAAICTLVAAKSSFSQIPPRPLVELWVGPNLIGDTRTMSDGGIYSNILSNSGAKQVSDSIPPRVFSNPSILDFSSIELWPETHAAMTTLLINYSDLTRTAFFGVPQSEREAQTRNFLGHLRSSGKKIAIVVSGLNPGLSCSSPGQAAGELESINIYSKVGDNIDYIVLDGPIDRAFNRNPGGYPHPCTTVVGGKTVPSFSTKFVYSQISAYIAEMKKMWPNSKIVLGVNFPWWLYGGTSLSPVSSNIVDNAGVVLDFQNLLEGLVNHLSGTSQALSAVSIDNPYQYITNIVDQSSGAATGIAGSPNYVNSQWIRLNSLVTQIRSLNLKAYVIANSEQFPTSFADQTAMSKRFFEDTREYSQALNSKEILLNGQIVFSWYNTPFLHESDSVFYAQRALAVPKAVLGEFEEYTFAYTTKAIAYEINKRNDPVFGVIGYIDGVVGGKTLNGWACGKYHSSAINVHLFINGPVGVGQFSGNYLANLTSEPEISLACNTSATAYRFAIPISSRFPKGTSLYVYGISPSGGVSKSLTNSGSYSSP